MQDLLDLYSVALYGPGVLISSLYPTPFTITGDTGDMGVTVGDGIGFDTVGNFTSIMPSLTGSPVATPAVGDPSNPRWDLLAIEYRQVGDTLIPKPSDPLTMVDLNLHDDFALVIVPGTASATPAYPTYTGPGFVLAGLQVPSGATMGNQILIDYSQRVFSRFGFSQQPVFVQEIPTGNVDGTNQVFTLSQTPITTGSLDVYKDGVKLGVSQYSLAGMSISMSFAPKLGEVIWASYVANSPNSQNPLQAVTETPAGTIDGTNLKFVLAQKPIYQAATNVYIDGVWVDPDVWGLVSTAGNQSYILFTNGYQPQPGEALEVQYWLFTWPNLTAVPSTSGGGGVTREIHGSYTSPIAIDPTVGLVPSSAADQTWYVIPNELGTQLITASPAIAPGTTIGQRVVYKGTDPANCLEIPSASGSGTNQNGSCTLTNNQAIEFEWDGVAWNENTRRL
jgi:hypothetical protein